MKNQEVCGVAHINMSMGVQRRWLLTISAGIILLLVALFLTAPGNPVALIRVVDAAGKPIAGAVLKADGMRTKEGPYVSGHYGWPSGAKGVPNQPVTTDSHGQALIPYPKYVFERIETGELSFSVNHPEFVPDRPFRKVTTAPPEGAPWKMWIDYLKTRIAHKEILAQTEPVVLQKGACLIVSVQPDSVVSSEFPLLAQVSNDWLEDPHLWEHPASGTVASHRLAAGLQAVRAVQMDARGKVWFGDTTHVTLTAGQTNKLTVRLQQGITVRGQLDSTLSRPVKNGRVIAQVWPPGYPAKDSPPAWHAWARVSEDGRFELPSLPVGDLEIVALCNGYVSTNGPGQFKMRYPQKHMIGTNDLDIIIGMEPTARLEVQVSDDQGHPLKGARVSTWPNVRYGEWFANVLGSDCYNIADRLFPNPKKKADEWKQSVADFSGTSDSSGLAVVPNVPAEVTDFDVEHPEFVLPAVETSWGDKRRTTTIALKAGQTNYIPVRLEPRGQKPIKHF